MSKKIRLLSLLFAATAAVVPLHAEDKVIAQITPDSAKKVTRGNAAWENDVLKCKLPCTVIFPARFKVAPGKIYTLSGEFRSTSGNPTSDNVWFGFICFNEKGREITSLSTFRYTSVIYIWI